MRTPLLACGAFMVFLVACTWLLGDLPEGRLVDAGDDVSEAGDDAAAEVEATEANDEPPSTGNPGCNGIGCGGGPVGGSGAGGTGQGRM